MEQGGEFKLNPEANTEAFRLHQKRFKEKSEEHNKRGKIRRKIEATKLFKKDLGDLSPVDIAHEEALSDDVDFEAKKREFAKELEQMGQPVIDHIKSKRNNLEGKQPRIGILVWAGGKKVSYSAGQLTAFHDLGYLDTIDEIYGISGGGPVGAYFDAGVENGPKGTSLLPEEASQGEFFNPGRFWQMLNIWHMSKPMREGPKALDLKKISESKRGLHVAVTTKNGENMKWLDMKSLPDPIKGLEATANVPFFFGDGVEIDGEKFYDGGFGKINIQEIIEQGNLDDLIILTNTPIDNLEKYNQSRLSKLFAEKGPKSSMPGMFRKFLQVTVELKKLIEEVKKGIKTKTGKEVNILVMFPPKGIKGGLTAVTMNSDDIKAAIHESYRATCKVFGEKPKNLELYKTPSN